MPPYSFSLNGGPSSSNNTFNNLSAGNYTVDVIDNSGCTASEVISLFNLAGPAIDSVIFQNPSCSDSLNGTIAVYGSTGVNLQYSIDTVTPIKIQIHFQILVMEIIMFLFQTHIL